MTLAPLTSLDPLEPANHGEPLWVVYGDYSRSPELMCVRLRAYDEQHELLPVGVRGAYVAIWGFSVWKRRSGFRTLGMNVEEWAARYAFGPFFYDVQDNALEHLQRITSPRNFKGKGA
jgi:hypothetical protein